MSMRYGSVCKPESDRTPQAGTASSRPATICFAHGGGAVSGLPSLIRS